MERWLPVVGFEGHYEVSDLGRVRSLDREQPLHGRATGKGFTRLLRGRLMRPVVNRKRGGYRYVNLHKDGKQHMRRVGRLVAAAFIGPCGPGLEVRHGALGVQDDTLLNICYGTPTENAADRRKHGTHIQGEKHGNAKLTEAAVRRIKYGRGQREVLAELYGVHVGHIDNIRRGTRWAHV